MTRLGRILAVALIILAGLVAYAVVTRPGTPEACERDGGTWTAHVEGYAPTVEYRGAQAIVTPHTIYSHYCKDNRP